MLGLGENIKKLLNIHDLTQKEFAKILGISSSALGNYIQNTREPDYLTLIQIANFTLDTWGSLYAHCIFRISEIS